MSENYYTTLGITREATPEEMKRAYRRFARELHPDVNPAPAAAERFKKIAAAYEVLSDPAMRREYDDTITANLGSEFSQKAAAGPRFEAGVNGRAEEIIRQARRKQEDNRRREEKLKDAAPENPAQEPSVEERREEFEQSVRETAQAVGKFLRKAKKDLGL